MITINCSETVILFLAGQGILIAGATVTAYVSIVRKLEHLKTALEYLQKNCPMCQP